MRKLKYLFALIGVAIMALSCENGSHNTLDPKPNDSKCYKGTMSVDQNDGTFYTQQGVEVDYELKDGKLNFVMYKVKFASGMPIKLDMVVEGVEYFDNGTSLNISGNNLVPYAMGGPFEKFTITELIGEISDSEFTLEFICGEYPVTYHGTR